MDDYIDELLQEFEFWIDDPDFVGQVDPEEYWDQDPGVSLEL